MFEAMLCCFHPAVKDDKFSLDDSAMLLKPCLQGKTGGTNRTANIVVMESGMTGMDITDTHQNVQTESLNAQAPTAPTAPSQPVTSDTKPACCTTQEMAAIPPTNVSFPFLSDEAVWTSHMPADIRRRRLLAIMHPHASAAWSAVSICGEACKMDVFVDAFEPKPDILVRGQDVFCNPLPLADVTTPVSPDSGLAFSRTAKQGLNVTGAIISICKLPAAMVCAVLACLLWVLRCMAGMVSGLVRAVVWAVNSFVKLPVGLVRAVACTAWAMPQKERVCDTKPSTEASAWWWGEFCIEEVVSVAKADGNLTLSCTGSSLGPKSVLLSVCKVLAAVVYAVPYTIAWALIFVVNMVTRLVRAVVWACARIVKATVGLVCTIACAAWAVLRGVVYVVSWPIMGACKLVGFIACAAWAVLRGVVYVVTWPVVQVVKLAALLVRSVFRILVWAVCTVLKVPLHLVLSVYYAVSCLVRGLIRGLVALKRAVFGPRCSRCAAVIEFDSSLVELSASELCALINPHRCTFQEVW